MPAPSPIKNDCTEKNDPKVTSLYDQDPTVMGFGAYDTNSETTHESGLTGLTGMTDLLDGILLSYELVPQVPYGSPRGLSDVDSVSFTSKSHECSPFSLLEAEEYEYVDSPSSSTMDEVSKAFDMHVAITNQCKSNDKDEDETSSVSSCLSVRPVKKSKVKCLSYD